MKYCHYCRGNAVADVVHDVLKGCCSICAARFDKSKRYNTLPCVVCGKQLEQSLSMTEAEITEVNVNNLPFHDGMAAYIEYGYGCSLDGRKYMIAICKECTIQKETEGNLIYTGNYITEMEPRHDEEDR